MFSEDLDLDEVERRAELLMPNLLDTTRLGTEVLRLSMSEDRHAFLFDFGVAVFWGAKYNFSNRAVQQLLAFTKRRLPEIEIESILFKEDSNFRISNQLITLSSSAPQEKLAVAYAIGQSLQLSCFEATVIQMNMQTEKIQIDLAERGEFSLSHRQSTQEIAKLLDFNFKVNLQSQLLDIPDLLWEDDDAQMVYVKTKSYLDISKRVDTLNQRLNMMSDFLWFFNSVQASRKLYNLDLTIMLVILVYVCCEVFWGILFRDILGNYRR
jgi:uncharacterized Rmd1/YagE family protein